MHSEYCIRTILNKLNKSEIERNGLIGYWSLSNTLKWVSGQGEYRDIDNR